MNQASENTIRIAILLSSLVFASEAFARRSELDLEPRVLQTAGFPVPASAAFLTLEGRSESALNHLCPLAGVKLLPRRDPSDERLSRSLKIRTNKGEVELDECARGNACFPLKPEMPTGQSQGSKTYLFRGRAGSYQVIAPAVSLSSNRTIECTSSAVEILQNARGELKFPSALWVLNYQKEIVLWDKIEQRVWFRFKLPEKESFGRKFTVSMDASHRMLLSDDKQSFLVADIEQDRALLRSSSGLYESRWGFGGTAYGSEWNVRSSSIPGLLLITVPGVMTAMRRPTFLGLSGIAHDEEFWSWEGIFSSLRGGLVKPLVLGGTVVTGSERLLEESTEVSLAVRKESEVADIITFRAGARTAQITRNGQRLDPRAQNSHFLLLGQELYRHTADGIYRVDSSSEMPSNLRGFKGIVEPRTHVIITRIGDAKNCSINVWPVVATFSGILEPVLGPLECSNTEAFGVSPWGQSMTRFEAGKLKSVLSSNQ